MISSQVFIVGAGFLADAYDLFVVDLVLSNLDVVAREKYPEVNAEEFDQYLVHGKSLIAASTLVGALCGQLFFGFLGDWVGRKWTFLSTCVLILVGIMLYLILVGMI